MLLVHLCFQQLPSSQGLMISVPFKPTQLAGKHSLNLETFAIEGWAYLASHL